MKNIFFWLLIVQLLLLLYYPPVQAQTDSGPAALPPMFELLLGDPPDRTILVVVTPGGLVQVTELITSGSHVFTEGTSTDLETAFPGILERQSSLFFNPTALVGYMYDGCRLPDGTAIPNPYTPTPYLDITCTFLPAP